MSTAADGTSPISPQDQALAGKKLLELAIVSRAQADAEFRARLLADPKRTLGEFGVRLPASVNVVVTEQAAETLHIGLPPLPKESGELDDAQLEAVAGGVWNTFAGNWSINVRQAFPSLFRSRSGAGLSMCSGWCKKGIS
jgi:hypothetical protein